MFKHWFSALMVSLVLGIIAFLILLFVHKSQLEVKGIQPSGDLEAHIFKIQWGETAPWGTDDAEQKTEQVLKQWLQDHPELEKVRVEFEGTEYIILVVRRKHW